MTLTLSKMWSTSPRRIECRNAGGDPYFNVDGLTLIVRPEKVEGEGPILEISSDRSASTDPRRTLPNMEACSGQISFALEDLIGLILERIEPDDLAVELCRDDTVRERMIYNLTHRYSDGHMTDADRRKMIRDLQGEVHSVQLDKLAYAVTAVENNAAKLACAADGIYDFNLFLSGHGAVDRNGEPLKYKRMLPQIVELGFNDGQSWADARDFWRNRVSALFASPERVENTPEPSEDPF